MNFYATGPLPPATRAFQIISAVPGKIVMSIFQNVEGRTMWLKA